MEAVAPILGHTRRMAGRDGPQPPGLILTNEQLQTQLSDVVVSREFTDAMRRMRQLSTVEFDIPTKDGFDRLAEMVEDGEIDEETIHFAEQAISEGVELSAAIDVAVVEVLKRRPLIPRWVVRRMITTWVWLMYGSLLYAAVITSPEIAAIPSSFGMPVPDAVANKADQKVDEHSPPCKDGADDHPKETNNEPTLRPRGTLVPAEVRRHLYLTDWAWRTPPGRISLPVPGVWWHANARACTAGRG